MLSITRYCAFLNFYDVCERDERADAGVARVPGEVWRAHLAGPASSV